jgi:CRISPR/Cas system-associated exonuclease Cas4 (RecB family)
MDVLMEVKKEIAAIGKKDGFSSASDVHLLADLMYLRCHLEEKEKKTAWEVSEQAETAIEAISNKMFDRNINALYDAYIEARRLYEKEMDYLHREKLIDALNKLMVEIYDLMCTIHTSAMFAEERDLVCGFIGKMNDL